MGQPRVAANGIAIIRLLLNSWLPSPKMASQMGKKCTEKKELDEVSVVVLYAS